MAYDEPAVQMSWWIHDPEAVQAYRRILAEETPERIGAELARALLEELPSLWSGEAAQGYLEEAQRRLEILRRWLEERRQLAEAVAAGEAMIAEAIAEVEKTLHALPEPIL